MDKMNKIVPFRWEFGEVMVSLEVGQYLVDDQLYIGLLSHTEDGTESFADMTINIPMYPLESPNEAVIAGDISRDLLRFIKEQKLGKVLPDKVRSGYGEYSVVAFNLDRLHEFDPQGVAEFKKRWNIPDKDPKQKKNVKKEASVRPSVYPSLTKPIHHTSRQVKAKVEER